MTDLLLIRHAETDHNLERRFQGQTQTPLNRRGFEQSRLLARRLSKEPIAAVYSSDLARARQTADILAASFGLPVCPLTGLREIDVGEAVGLTRADLRERCPDLFGPQWAEARFPRGESHSELSARIAGTVRDIAAAHPHQRIAVVTHGGGIRALLSALVDIPLEALVGLIVENTSISRLRRSADGRFRLRGLNDAAHLESWPAHTENGHAEPLRAFPSAPADPLRADDSAD